MKTPLSLLPAGALGAVLFLAVSTGIAADSNAPVPTAPTTADVAATPALMGATASVTAVAKAPLDDVVKLSRAQISQEVILNYVRNSGTVYNLSPSDIVYLRDQRVSDQVINAMQDQRTRVGQEVVQAPTAVAPGNPAPAPVLVPDSNAAATTVVPQQAPTVIPAPADASSGSGSSVYVIQNPQVEAAYYGYYRPYGYYYPPYPYPYSYYGGPVVTFGFGYGGYGCYPYRYYGGHGYYGGGHGYYHGYGGHYGWHR